MKTFLNLLVGLTCLAVLTIIGLALTKHLIVTSERRMVNVVDDMEYKNVLFQMPTETIDYTINFVK